MESYTATIIVNIDYLGIEEKKYFVGTEEEIYAEAHDFMNEVVMRFIDENAVEDPYEQYLIADCASVYYCLDKWNNEPTIAYAVFESGSDSPVYGVYPSRSEAEEAILIECETFAYEVMMTDDPADVIGCDEWDWCHDYKWLMWDAGRTFSIQEVPVYM